MAHIFQLHFLFNCFSSLSLSPLVGSCRFITSHVPTDLTIQVQEITFNVHKVTTEQDNDFQFNITGRFNSRYSPADRHESDRVSKMNEIIL